MFPDIIYSIALLGVIIFAFFLTLFLPRKAFAGKEPAKGDGAEVRKNGLPGDVYPDSRFRLPLPRREDFDEEGKTIFDRRVGKGARSLRGLRGPSGIRLYSPKLAEYSSLVSRYLRFETGFSGSIRELAILVTAREMDSQFEWAAHEPEALKEGLTREIIEIVKYRRKTDGLPDLEAAVIQLGRQMFGPKKVDADTFARALRLFGPRGLVDLVSLMINYQGTASMLTAFDVQLDPGQQPLLPAL